MYARNTKGNAGEFGGSYVGVIGRALPNGFPLIGTDPSGNNLFYVVTPNGDTRGLFVATKTPDGFVVREAQGGRSTVAFNYCIVATALGRSGQKDGADEQRRGLGVAPRAASPVVPATNAPARLQAAPALPAP